jgi:hypothetical protein
MPTGMTPTGEVKVAVAGPAYTLFTVLARALLGPPAIEGQLGGLGPMFWVKDPTRGSDTTLSRVLHKSFESLCCVLIQYLRVCIRALCFCLLSTQQLAARGTKERARLG